MTDASTAQRPDAWDSVIAYVLQDDLHNRLTPRVVDVAYTAFMKAKGKNDEDGGPTDWFTDTRPLVLEMIEKIKTEVEKELSARVKELEAPRRVKALPRATGDGGWVLDPSFLMLLDAAVEAEGWDGSCLEVYEVVALAVERRLSSCYEATPEDAIAKARSDAINDFSAKLGLKMTDEVKGLPDDVRLFRAQAAIRGGEGE